MTSATPRRIQVLLVDSGIDNSGKSRRWLASGDGRTRFGWHGSSDLLSTPIAGDQHEPTIAVRRARTIHPEFGALSDAESASLLARGHHALGVMEQTLRDHDFLVEDRFSIADVALYVYTHVAHEGGYDLERYPGIRAWLGRCLGSLPTLRIDQLPGGATGGARC